MPQTIKSLRAFFFTTEKPMTKLTSFDIAPTTEGVSTLVSLGEKIADAFTSKDTEAVAAAKVPSTDNLIPETKPSPSTSPNNPENPQTKSDPIISGITPEILHAPAIALMELLGICSPVTKDDIQGKKKSKGSESEKDCCDCGEGGVPVVGGGYILKKTLERVQTIQKAGLNRYVEKWKAGKLNDGQAIQGLVKGLNQGLSTGNTDLIPTAAKVPIGEQAVQISLKDACKKGDAKWIKTAATVIGTEKVIPYIKANSGSLMTSLTKRNDTTGIQTMNDIDATWADDMPIGSAAEANPKANGLTEAQQIKILNSKAAA